MRYLISHKLFFIAMATALGGTFVRYLNDKEVQTISKARKLGYFFTGLFAGILLM